ncbi:transglutaminase domain-containing protein [Nocardioides sp.]|uniref:DUF3488 and transglutaminase-like domain-containing protein n=1 Tax=Nocardioides sp. TaxID=35761 RepID=UPI002737517F|nr:transglutaminase domain-containing protein [Nocardioides sp.]MDP3889653.1 transglutaminaseTgpA domain-containing protein [Nocardioides sp.]
MTRLLPNRHTWVDAGFLLSLAVVATLGFGESFNGWAFLLVAMVGWLLGAVLAHVATALDKPAVVTAVFTVAAFFLLGGAVALSSDGLSSALPLPGTLMALADQSIHGWKDLLTTLAPVDGGPLLTLPYLMGLIGGAAGMTAAARVRSAFLVVLVPLAYLAGVILLGVRSPERVVLIGSVFAVLALVWMSVRGRRFQARTMVGGLRLRRRIVGVALVVGAGLVATTLGPRLPFVHDNDRLVLRSYVTPPFDVGQYPSPLVSFRKYTKGFVVDDPDEHLYDRPLMTVSGLPEGTRLRFATLDSYNGTVWGASNQAPGTTGQGGSFQRVGSVIRDEFSDDTATATVEIEEGYADQVWLPTAGHLSEIRFEDDDQSGATFRYNLESATGVVPQGLSAGQTYTFTANVASDVVEPTTEAGTTGVSTVETTTDFAPVASRWGGEAQTSMLQVLDIAEFLKTQGTYTDGEVPNQQYAAGHSERRLAEFGAEGSQIAGNDEQYAAMLALLANQVGVPARVVVGAQVPADGVVKGEDVHAWLELQDVDGTWRTLPTEAFMDNQTPPEDKPPVPQQLVSGQVVPPPAPVAPPATIGDPFSDSDQRKGEQVKDDDGAGIPSWVRTVLLYAGLPLLGLALMLLAIVLLKARRRRLRRTRGEPATQLSAGWRDLLDAARDLGVPVHAALTRREQAREIGHRDVATLAKRADAHVFGLGTPTADDSAAYWSEVDQTRKRLAADLSIWRRTRAAVSLASFRAMSKAEPLA